MKTLLRLLFGARNRAGGGRCGDCDHFDNTPGTLEEAFQGVNALSSVHGSSRGDSGICRRHDRYLLPVHRCPDFQQKT
jgi:hypothetical protein